MMLVKKVILVLGFVSFTGVIQAKALPKNSKDIEVYFGVGLSQNFMNSKFLMNREVDLRNHLGRGDVRHEGIGIQKLGCELFVGLISGSDWFIGPEFRVNLQHIRHRHTFLDNEDYELTRININGDVSSHIDIKYGNSYQLVLKFGKTFDDYRIYGIVGAERRSVSAYYRTDSRWLVNQFYASSDKKLNSPVFGIGGSKRIRDNLSLALEYKYKLCNSWKFMRDWREGSSFSVFRRYQWLKADLTEREFEVKHQQHEVSLRVVVNF